MIILMKSHKARVEYTSSDMNPLHLQTIFSMTMFEVFKTDNIYINAIFTTISFALVNMITSRFETLDLFSWINYTHFKNWFSKCAYVVLTGDRVRTINEYNGKPIVSNTFSNTFSALWEQLIDNIDTNETVSSLTEMSDPANQYNHSNQTEHLSYYISQPGQFIIDKELDIYGKVVVVYETSDDNKKLNVFTQRITLELVSYKCSVCKIRDYLNNLTQKYIDRIANARKTKRFVYEIRSLNCEESGTCWMEHEFNTTRSFDNMFFDGKSDFLKKIDFFVKNKEWYYTMGVPYTMGIGLYGPPGTGKTSLIKSLAKYLNRHVVTISMKMFKTRKQLTDCYYEMTYNSSNTRDSITFDKKIIVMEDIDCLGDIVLKRKESTPAYSHPRYKGRRDDLNLCDIDARYSDGEQTIDKGGLQAVMKNIIKEEDPITLDDILNIWDGIRETPGRVIVISSNHYDKLDPALTRPGRIDITMEMSYASKNTIVEMYEHFFSCKMNSRTVKLLPDKKYTPAEIMNMYLTSNFSKEVFINKLTKPTK